MCQSDHMYGFCSRDDDSRELLPDGELSHQAKMHKAFAGTSLRIAMFQIPASCFERWSSRRIIFLVSWVWSAGGVGVFLAFGGVAVFFVAHGEV